MTKFHYLLFFISSLLIPLVSAQETLQAGNAAGTKDYIDFLPGNMPLVISIPHGGYLKPGEVPERPCDNCAKNQDIFTIEIGTGIRDAIYRKTGFQPFVIINNLHRTRLDPNRNIKEAADGDINAEAAWLQFQNYIDSAVAEVYQEFGKGLYIDLHGHRHLIKMTELGYLLSSDELQLEDDLLDLDSFVEYSSIRSLINDNVNGLSYSQLVRGEKSLGSLLENLGYSTVPSPAHFFPGSGEPYFSGGYNTSRHGSSNGGTIDGIQIELDEDVRMDSSKQDKLINDLATVIIDFLRIHYFPDAEFSRLKDPC
ncbi:MAG: hypothetical protein E4G92_03045 [Bacteroidia bacterium]|nr:MAG: hypothetical protein E4G92_03045 [Bacteroidia bacterium]